MTQAIYLGIDYGTKKVGLAISSPDGTFVFGRGTLRVTDHHELLDRLQSLITQEHVTHIVVGYPLNTDGTQGENTKSVDTFVKLLKERTPLPVDREDERYTTQYARTLAGERKGADDDEGAARIILQSYLDRTRNV